METCDDLMKRVTTAKALKERKDFESGAAWYVENIIPKGTLCYLIGTEKSYKSTTMLDMALAISSGQQFLQEKTTQAKVLYIQPENTAVVEHMRLKQTARESTDNLHMLMYQFRIDDIEHMRFLYRYIKENDIKVIVLDNLKDLISTPEALNDMTTANRIIQQINKLKMLFEDVTFIITHHTSKARLEQSLTEKDFRVLPSMGLGSSAWSASYEVCITLSPKRGKNSQFSYLSVFARNFMYNKPIAVGYVADQFTYILQGENEDGEKEVKRYASEPKPKEPDGVSQEFLDELVKSGKVKEVDG